ncbi:MAG: hypothetical protein LBB85_01160 [Dysgonamonadaceae bacterium]|jgi:hypothetical protein|nr:hypothetical protein [Dysgonamonadaceae bacterium]
MRRQTGSIKENGTILKSKQTVEKEEIKKKKNYVGPKVEVHRVILEEGLMVKSSYRANGARIKKDKKA